MSEGRILAALQDEVTAAETRLEEERAAHVNTQRAADARDQVRLLALLHPHIADLHILLLKNACSAVMHVIQHLLGQTPQVQASFCIVTFPASSCCHLAG